MWSIENAADNSTNKATVPADGIISVTKPDSVQVYAYVNGVTSSVHHVHVKAGDTVHFKMKNTETEPAAVSLEYMGTTSNLIVPAATEELVISAEDGIISIKENIMTPAETINLFSNPMGGNQGGAMGAGLGAGLVGGLLGTALFGRNGLNGGIAGDGMVNGAVLRNPPEQNQANMDLMAAVGAVDKSVAISTATMEASQATQTLGITTQLNNVASSLAARTDNLKDIVNSNSVALMQGQAVINQNIMENRYELSRDISNDGEKTRSLITQQYELNLQRQLADANAAIIELRSREYAGSAARGVEVTTTNNINQMQQQQQQQAQYGQLAGLIYSLGQSIRNTDSAINVGSGTQTSTPTNTNTNIR